MARDNGEGIFSMQFINEIDKMTYNDAVRVAFDRINQSKASEANKQKATAMVSKAISVHQLVLGMGNFTLSHMGLKTLR